MTLPTLISNINDKVSANQAAVFNSKLIKGLNLTKTAGDLNDTYKSTYDFLNKALSKNLKMTKICDANHIRDCLSYDKIKYTNKGEEKTFEISKIKTAKNLGLDSPFEDIAAFVLGDGTPAIVSYNKKCLVDTEKLDKSISGCLAGVYDINGTRKPNKFLTKIETDKNGKEVTSLTGDVRTFNGASVSPCIGKIGNVCISTGAVYPKDVWQNYFDEMPKYNTSKNDYYGVAQEICKKNGGHLPSANELAQIATALYGETIGDAENKTGLTMKNKEKVYAALGITDNPSWFRLWSSVPNSTDYAYYRYFGSDHTSWVGSGRHSDPHRVVCLGE